jgi:hypothetical protein
VKPRHKTHLTLKDLERWAENIQKDLDIVDAIIHRCAHSIESLEGFLKRMEKGK